VIHICGAACSCSFYVRFKKLSVATEVCVCRSWKEHVNGQHDKAIEALQHYFTQVVSGVSLRQVLCVVKQT